MRKLLLTFLLCLILATPAFAQFFAPHQKPSLGLQINKAHQLGDPVAFYLCNEGAGGIVQDLSGNGNVGTFGAATLSPSWTTGKYGSGINFDGGDYIDLGGDNPQFEGISQLSIVSWVRTSATTDTIISKAHSTPSWSQETSAGGKAQFRTWTGAGNVTSTGTTSINDGLWHQVVAVYDGANQYVYTDGVLEDTDAQTQTITVGNDGVAIGCLWNNNVSRAAYWNGDIDHILVFIRVLSSSEIVLLYQGPFCMFEPSWNYMLYGGISITPSGQIIFIN